MKSPSKATKASASAEEIMGHPDALKRMEGMTGEGVYQDLIVGLPVAVYTCNADGFIEFYNYAALQLWGRKPELGKDKWSGAWKTYSTDGTPLEQDEVPMAIALNQGRIINPEIVIERPDGTRRSIIPNPQIIYDADGNITGGINTLIDITEQVDARKKTDQSEEQFSTLANSIQNLAWMADHEGWIFWYNHRWYEYTGTTHDEMQGWGWQSVHDPEKLPAVLEKWKHSIASGQPFEMVFPLKGADNVFRSFLTRVFPIRDAQGYVARWVGTNTDIHEQKTFAENLEASIKESDMRMQAVLQDAPDAVIIIDWKGEIINWNPQAEFIFGWKADEVFGKTLPETIIPERYRDQHASGIRRFLKTGSGPVIDTMIEIFALRKDQSEFPVELKISSSIINGRHIFIGFVRDISQRKQAQEALKNKTTQLVDAQQLAHIGSWEWHLSSNKLEWSDELYRIFGFAPQEFEASYEVYLQYIHPDDKETLTNTIEKTLIDHQPYNFFHRIVRGDGSERIINSTGKVFLDSNQNPIRLSGTAQDVTEQKKYEAELIKSEERYHRMVDEVEDYAILYLSKEGIVENWNKGAEKIKGYKAEEIIGKHFSLFYTEADFKNQLPERLLDEARQNGSARHEGWRVRKDGSTFWGSIVITTLHEGKGNIIGFSKVTRDLTEKKKAEDRIMEDALRLKHKNEQLEKMNKELQSFAYVSSHDLQEPLRKIQTFANRILEKEAENLSETGKDQFKRMYDAARRMQTLIEDLLAYSRTTREELRFEQTDLNKILEEVKVELKEELQQKHATIEASEMCEAHIIPFQFRQLMHNIIGNALKFSRPDTPPKIKIKSEILKGSSLNNQDLSPQKKYCHVVVSDNGIGFDPRYSEKIFEVFQRLHGKEHYKGTGIGLAIVKKIVENHSGVITATGALGKGATFDIYLPTP